jgi:hypothetical protein
MPFLTTSIMSTIEEENLDIEWVELILCAIEIGISSEEIGDFLRTKTTL